MKTVIPLDFSNRSHRALLFDLALENKDHLLNDVDNDIPTIIWGYEELEKIGECYPFVAVVDGVEAGCFWLEVDRYGIGRPRGALFNEYKTAWNGRYFLQWIVDFGFQTLGLRKLDAEMVLYPKTDLASKQSERLLKMIGFKKRAILPQEIMINGIAKDTILLDYLKRDHDVKKEIQHKQHARPCRP